MCFIDHASGYVSNNHQVAINANETVNAKTHIWEGGSELRSVDQVHYAQWWIFVSDDGVYV